ncbi:putative membrane protein [Kitasatospora sp. GP82]|nr:putative membrane protein [Kitasatospora sp. GP82]
MTITVDRAAYDGRFSLATWVLSGTADGARQILTTIAAAVITVVGLVFSITIVALTLASTQFGPRMLRNFIRDRGTQLTLGTFVATFFYTVLVLVSISPGPHGDFVPHLSITLSLGLTLVDLAVLIYFINHIATMIQLPQVIASIADDLARAIEDQGGTDAEAPEGLDSGPSRMS